MQSSYDKTSAPVRWGIAVALASLLSFVVTSSFLLNWSLLDSFPRNGFQAYLDGTVHRPFAYRTLAPTVVEAVQGSLPAQAGAWLADRFAPLLYTHYVQPWQAKYDAQFAGFGKGVELLWSSPTYRANYALMVTLMVAALAGALVVSYATSRELGCSEATSNALMVLHALVFATGFLNGGYFYDFTEQLFAAVLLYCVVSQKWLVFSIALLLMQINKETAMLMLCFVAPLIAPSRARMAARYGGALLIVCITILLTMRHIYANSPGSPVEWNLVQNIHFWMRSESWTATSDILAISLPLPRVTFLLLWCVSFVYAACAGFSRYVIAAFLAMTALTALLLTMGYRDEFRAAALALPFLVVAIAARAQSASVLTGCDHATSD